MAKIIFRRNVNDKYMYDILVCPSYKLHGKPAPPVLAATIHSDTVGDMGIDTDGDQVHDKARCKAEIFAEIKEMPKI